MDNKELGSRIAELRKQNNLSQKDLADQLNISNKTISKWECGNGSPDIESLQKLSKIFNITLDELLKNEPPQPMPEEPRQSDIKSANRIYGAVWEENSSFTPIGSVEDFLKINNNLSGNYYLTNDIDLNGISFTGFGSEEEPFSGIFDGKGHIISNYTYSNASDDANYYVGIFNYSIGLVKNIGIENYSISINTGYAGGLVGYNSGTILNSFTNGQVITSRYSGGIVSYNTGEIINCYTKGIINAHEKNGYRTNVYAGGIAAYNEGTIQSVYSLSEVYAQQDSSFGTSGTFRAGGLVGNNSSSGIIKNSFATGKVSAKGTSDVAGNIAGSNEGNIILCFYLSSQIVEDSNNSIITIGTPTSLKNLYKLIGLSWQLYIDDTYLWLYDESVWVLNENDYPSLYWEKNL